MKEFTTNLMIEYQVDIRNMKTKYIDNSSYMKCVMVEDILIDLQYTPANQLSEKLHRYQLHIEDLMEANERKFTDKYKK